jgi:hypothetical protein
MWGGGRGVGRGEWGGGGGGGGAPPPPPQRNDPVGLQLSAVGLKIMRLFRRGVCEANLIFNIFETRRRIRLNLLKRNQAAQK